MRANHPERSTRRRPTAVRTGAVLTLAASLMSMAVGCAKPTAADPVPNALTVVQGTNQQVQGGSELPNALAFRVLGADKKPLAKVSVGFSIVTGGGTVNPGSALSDENGEVKTKWTLGPNEVGQSLRATVAGLDAITVNALALLPTDLVVAQGNNQSARVNAALPNAIVLRVVGPGNVAMKGIPVAFQIVTGGGLITPQSGLTNALGEVQSRWTVGSAAGTNTLAVTSGSLQAVILSATAVP